jgi:Nif-specific regulatory protein
MSEANSSSSNSAGLPAITRPPESPPTSQATLDLLYEVTQALTHIDDTEHLLETVLNLLQRHGFHWVALKVIDPETGDIRIRSSSGLTSEQRNRARYRIGEGITGKVMQTGLAIAVRQTSEDNRFLNRTGSMPSSEDGSYYCYPIRSEGQMLGVLSAAAPLCKEDEHRARVHLFTVLLPIISQSFRIADMIRQERLEADQLRSRIELPRGLDTMIGRSSQMLHVFDQTRQVASSQATVLIRGSNGTGKELIADAIHELSPRRQGPLVKVNCGAIPENLLESELFGHEKGSFTGAVQTKQGKIELAEGGTFFLDEIGEMSLALQSKLLRFLQNREFERVGGLKTLQSDVRIVAATNVDLEEAMQSGRFREDLYYRLNVFPIFLPALRDRKSDIVLLADHFLEKFRTINRKEIQRLSTPAIDMLLSYHWPGNVRELENCMERAVIVCESDTIRAQDLPPSLQIAPEASSSDPKQHWSMPEAVANLEKEMIYEALHSAKGHQGQAARHLGITERQMGYKMKKYGIVRSFSKG